MTETADNIGGKRRRWFPSGDGEAGQMILEYTLLLASFGIPLTFLVRWWLLTILAAQYQLVTFLETLPLP